MAAQWPLVVAKLLELLPTLDGWDQVRVLDGPVRGPTPKQYATVGYASDDAVGTYSTTQAADGWRRAETGAVISKLTCQSGDKSTSTHRTQAFALMDALDDYLHDPKNRTLGGVLSAEGTSDLAVDVHTLANENGTAQSLIFTLTYTTVV